MIHGDVAVGPIDSHAPPARRRRRVLGRRRRRPRRLARSPRARHRRGRETPARAGRVLRPVLYEQPPTLSAPSGSTKRARWGACHLPSDTQHARHEDRSMSRPDDLREGLSFAPRPPGSIFDARPDALNPGDASVDGMELAHASSTDAGPGDAAPEAGAPEAGSPPDAGVSDGGQDAAADSTSPDSGVPASVIEPGHAVSVWATGTSAYFNPDPIDTDGTHVWVAYQNIPPPTAPMADRDTGRPARLSNTAWTARWSLRRMRLPAIRMECVSIRPRTRFGFLPTKMPTRAYSRSILRWPMRAPRSRSTR